MMLLVEYALLPGRPARVVLRRRMHVCSAGCSDQVSPESPPLIISDFELPKPAWQSETHQDDDEKKTEDADRRILAIKGL